MMRRGLDKGKGKGYRNRLKKDRKVHSDSARGIKQKQRLTTPDMKNLPMNEETYKLRREAIGYIYELKKLTNLPRINVRITELSTERKSIAGRGGTAGTYVIWLPKRTFNLPDNAVRFVIYHEILHTVYGKKHDKNSVLMRKSVDLNNLKYSKERLHKEFMKEINED